MIESGSKIEERRVIKKELRSMLRLMHSCHVLRLFRMLNLFPSVGTKVVKHYTTVEVHRSFPQGVVS